jgi:hypothetical protein
MFVNRPVIGIDVAKEFCFYAAALPNGKPFLKPLKPSIPNKVCCLLWGK